MQQRTKQMLRLALGLLLLGAQPFKFVDDLGEFLLEVKRWKRTLYGFEFYSGQMSDCYLGGKVCQTTEFRQAP